MPCLFQTGCGFIGLGRAQPVLNSSDGDPARTPDDELRTGNGIPSIKATMICRRLSCALGTDHLFAFLQDSAGLEWRKLFIQDTRLVWVMLSSRVRELPDPAIDAQTWEAWWERWPHQWKGLFRKLRVVLARTGDMALRRWAPEDPVTRTLTRQCTWCSGDFVSRLGLDIRRLGSHSTCR